MLLPGCVRAEPWLSLMEEGGKNGRIESADVLHAIKHVTSFWEDQLLLLMTAAQRKKKKDNSQSMEWFESTQEVESNNDSGNCIFFFLFFLPTLVFCRLWKQNADLNPPRGRGWSREGSLLQCLNRRWAVTNDNWHMPPFQWLIKGDCSVTALHFFFFNVHLHVSFFCSTSSCLSPCQSLFYDG